MRVGEGVARERDRINIYESTHASPRFKTNMVHRIVPHMYMEHPSACGCGCGCGCTQERTARTLCWVRRAFRLCLHFRIHGAPPRFWINVECRHPHGLGMHDVTDSVRTSESREGSHAFFCSDDGLPCYKGAQQSTPSVPSFGTWHSTRFHVQHIRRAAALSGS